jgi:hypothetical protein
VSALRSNRARFSWKKIVVGGVAASALAAALLVPLSASAATAIFSGTVNSSTGTHVAGATVRLYSLSTHSFVTSTTSSSSGAFAFSGVLPGSYTLWFDATAVSYPQFMGGYSEIAYAGQIYSSVAIDSAAYTTVILRPSGTASGTVSTSAGKKLGGYTVRAWIADSLGRYSVVKSTVSASTTGKYSLTGLEPGNYRLEAVDLAHSSSLYAPVFSGGASSIDTASDVALVGTKTTTTNFALATSGKITGTVSGSSGAEHLAGVTVNVLRLVGTPGSFASSEPMDRPSTTTTSSGAFALSGLPAGYYTLEFVPPATPVSPSTTVYGREFLGKASEAIDATFFQVVDTSAITGLNIQLGIGATVHGEILEAESMPTQIPIDDVKVTIDHAGVDPEHPSKDAQTVFTDASLGDQSFSFAGLGPGDYILTIGSLTEGNTSREITVAALSNGTVSLGQDRLERIPVDLADVAGLYPLLGNEPTIQAFSGYTVGDYLSADHGIWSQPYDQSLFTYQWYLGGHLIPGATSQSLEIAPGYLGLQLTVDVGICTFSYGCANYVTSATPSITEGTAQQSSPALMTGNFVVGQTLTAGTGIWNVDNVTYTYQWEVSSDQSSWVPAITSDGETHVVTSSDLLFGPYVRAHFSGTRTGYFAIGGYSTAANTPIVAGTFTQASPTKVTKSASQFSVVPGNVTPAGGSTSAAWTVWDTSGGSTVSSGLTLPTAGTAGQYVTVTTTHSANGFTDLVSAPLTVQTGAAPISTGPAVVVGTPQVGQSLSAPALSWSPLPTTQSWKWQAKSGSSWVTIPGATASTYSPSSIYLGKALRVISASQTTGYTSATTTSPATTPVVIGDEPVSSGVVVSPNPPATLTAVTVDPGTFTPAATSVTYQWKQSANGGTSYSPISGAKSSTYSVPVSLFGRTLAVDVIAKRTGHATSTTTAVAGVVTHGFLAKLAAPVVSHSGTVYTVTPGSWSPMPTSVDYAWDSYDLDNTTPGVIATTPSFDVTGVPLHRRVSVVVTVHASGYSDTQYVIDVAKKGDLIATATPALAAGTVDSTFTASTVGWGQNVVTHTYQWQYLSGSTWKSISGAKNVSFAPTGSTYVGKMIRVHESTSAPYYNPGSVYSQAALVSSAAAPTPGTGGDAPSITGSVGINAKLTANPGVWSTSSGISFTYRWMSSPDHITYTPIAGSAAAKSTYTVPEAMLGQYIRVQFSSVKAGYASASTTADAGSAIGVGSLNSTKSPTVKKSSKGTYSVSKGSWSAAPTGYSYLWESVDPSTDVSTTVAGPSATATSYKPVAADGAAVIQVTVTPSRANYATVPKTVVARKGVTVKPTSTPLVFGGQTVGSQLIALATDWNVVAPTVTITWLRDGKTIAGATGAGYFQTTADVGHTVSAKFSASKSGYISKSYTVAAPKTLFNVTPSATTAPHISGAALPDEMLVATPGVWTISGLTFTYQWLRAGLPIPGQTVSTYLVGALDVYTELSVRVTTHKANYPSGSASSQSMTVDYAQPVDQTTTLGALPAQVANGVQLTAPSTSYSLPATVTYIWSYQLQAEVSGWGQISGATGSSYTPNGFAPGDKITVHIYGSRPGHYDNITQSSVVVIQ